MFALLTIVMLACPPTPPPSSVMHETYKASDYGHGVYFIRTMDGSIPFATILGEFINDHPELRVVALDGNLVVTRPASDCPCTGEGTTPQALVKE